MPVPAGAGAGRRRRRGSRNGRGACHARGRARALILLFPSLTLLRKPLCGSPAKGLFACGVNCQDAIRRCRGHHPGACLPFLKALPAHHPAAPCVLLTCGNATSPHGGTRRGHPGGRMIGASTGTNEPPRQARWVEHGAARRFANRGCWYQPHDAFLKAPSHPPSLPIPERRRGTNG